MFDLDQKATIYNQTGSDGFGGYSYQRFEIDCKYAGSADKVSSASGSEIYATTVIYTRDKNFKSNSKVFLGVTASIDPPPESRDIRKFKGNESVTDMRVGWFV